ncbi:MAG: hydantoinase/oxoprolinase family protein, partial [Gammaproteobacteria bacterium]|nr:hydantoinase/oxoprolinase family protein [Gammaproteobacteria bacterium]
HGVLGIVVANMVRTIRTISVERGHDPRDFVLMPFGGAGPLQARDVAVALGMKEMVIPAAPGIVCAQGLLVSDLKEDFVSSTRFKLDESNGAVLAGLLEQLNTKAQLWFQSESAPTEGRRVELVVDARYVGQNFELAVPIVAGAQLTPADLPDMQVLHAQFCEVHELAYGYASTESPVEIVNVRLSASARLHVFENRSAAIATPPAPIARAQQPVFFDGEHSVATNLYDRSTLLSGQRIHGPAIVEQLDTTTPIYPGDIAEVTPDGHLIVTINAELLS